MYVIFRFYDIGHHGRYDDTWFCGQPKRVTYIVSGSGRTVSVSIKVLQKLYISTLNFSTNGFFKCFKFRFKG